MKSFHQAAEKYRQETSEKQGVTDLIGFWSKNKRKIQLDLATNKNLAVKFKRRPYLVRTPVDELITIFQEGVFNSFFANFHSL